MADCVQTGRALAVLAPLTLAVLTLAGGAMAQQPAQTSPGAPQTKPAPPRQGFPWAHPVLPQLAPPAPAPGPNQAGPNRSVPSQAAPQIAPPVAANQGATTVSPTVLRPSARSLIDCNQAPKNAITRVPEPLAKWATVYCTLQGHILTTNERYYSAVPGTQGKLRGVLGAAALNNQNGNIGHGAYFTKIEYAPLDSKAAAALTAGVDAKVAERVKSKPLFRLDLTTDKGQVYHGVVVDPEHDPFWVIPIVNGKIGQAGFYAATVDYVNKTRMQ